MADDLLNQTIRVNEYFEPTSNRGA